MNDFPDMPAHLDRRSPAAKAADKPRTKPGELIKEYLDIRAFRESETKRFNEFMKPHNERMQAIENELLAQLNESKLDNFKSDDGTAYKQTSMTPKVADREKWFDWVAENWDKGGNEMLQFRAPAVEGLRNWMQDNGGQCPPGVTVDYSTYVNIRKA